MAKVHSGKEILSKDKKPSPSRVHERYRQTTDDMWICDSENPNVTSSCSGKNVKHLILVLPFLREPLAKLLVLDLHC